MYIYKKHGKKYSLLKDINTEDEYVIEEYIIKLIREYIHKKVLPKIHTQYTGYYTIYYTEQPNIILVVSKTPLPKSS